MSLSLSSKMEQSTPKKKRDYRKLKIHPSKIASVSYKVTTHWSKAPTVLVTILYDDEIGRNVYTIAVGNRISKRWEIDPSSSASLKASLWNGTISGGYAKVLVHSTFGDIIGFATLEQWRSWTVTKLSNDGQTSDREENTNEDLPNPVRLVLPKK